MSERGKFLLGFGLTLGGTFAAVVGAVLYRMLHSPWIGGQ